MIEPHIINRSLVFIKPKEPYYDWANSNFPETLMFAEEVIEYNSYLLKDEIIEDDAKKTLQKYWEFIFEDQLFGVSTDENDWPEKLTWKLFMEWFECSFSSIVIDLEKGGILKEEY